ncbi:hypothetical protein QBC46DRAFT_358922 [Diplogelasinospora grovesii]|uniref:Uncharacterized protein n=1 Tax=Diplogelasinospora grovesii TaxID=303347 RepID=A0AAN6MW36_9PEZI|nr:hypothetical protein QBC46DRAFT_358922 [Diplogelasinospora grovesii]
MYFSLSVSILLVGFTLRVLASVAAAPYEAIYFYYAYLMEYEAKSGTNVLMGWDCASAGGACSFDEFVQSVYQGRMGEYTGGFDPTSYPETTTIDELASDLQDMGFNTAHFDPWYLKKPGLNSRDDYTRVMNQVANTVQESRAAGVTGRNLNLTRDALGGILEQRLADEVEGETSYLVDWLVEFDAIEINWDRTYENLGNDPDRIASYQQQIDIALEPYLGEGGDGFAHRTTIESVKRAQNRVWNFDNTC